MLLFLYGLQTSKQVSKAQGIKWAHFIEQSQTGEKTGLYPQTFSKILNLPKGKDLLIRSYFPCTNLSLKCLTIPLILPADIYGIHNQANRNLVLGDQPLNRASWCFSSLFRGSNWGRSRCIMVWLVVVSCCCRWFNSKDALICQLRSEINGSDAS